jgi:hypothetical protein
MGQPYSGSDRVSEVLLLRYQRELGATRIITAVFTLGERRWTQPGRGCRLDVSPAPLVGRAARLQPLLRAPAKVGLYGLY